MAIRFDNIEVTNLLNHQGEQSVQITGDQGINVTANAQMVTGNSTGKFAVMSTGVHGSYDFYNNGTTYLNGSTIIDAACTIAGQLTVDPDGDSKIILGNGGTNASVVFGGSGDDLYLGGGNSSNVRLHQGGSYQSDFYGQVTVDENIRSKKHLGLGSNNSYAKVAHTGVAGTLWGGSGSTTGQIVIDLPGTLANFDMAYIEIDVYEYTSDAATKIIIGGHNWNSGANSGTGNLQWYNTGVQVIGSLQKAVYLGRRNDGSSERRCIAIGDPDSVWSYATVHVAKCHGATFYGSNMDWAGVWGINQTTSTSFFTKSPTTNYNAITSNTLRTNGRVYAKALSSPQINLHTANSEVHLIGNGTTFGKFYKSSDNFYINNPIQDKDIIFSGNDGGSSITALTLDMSNGGSATFRDDVDLGGSINMTGTSKVLKMNNGGFIDFDGTNLQLNTQRHPNTGGFHDTGKSHAHIGLQGKNGAAKIVFGTAAANNTTATTRMEIDQHGTLEFVSTHSHGNLYMNYPHGSDAGNSGTLTAWVSEPGITYHSAGIGANIHRSSPYYGRAYNSGYGTYMRFHKDTGHITFANTTGTSGTSGGQGNVKFTMSQNGTFTAVGDVIAYSDSKLKENVKTLKGDKVLQMRGVSFDRKDTGLKGSGVIAQEVQKIAPELVHKDADGILGVAYGNLTGYLIEAIKEQQQTISKLVDRIEKLENK